MTYEDRRAAMLVLLVTGFVFAPAIGFEWISEWDDQWLVLENPYLVDGSLPRLWESLDPRRNLFAWGAEYLPLRNLSYFVDRWLWGFDPAGWHAHNVLLHALSAVAVLFMLRRLGCDSGPATAGALFFALHALHVEPVAWVTDRKTCLALLFVSIGGACWARIAGSAERSARDGLLPAACLVAAALSKASALAMPALFVALDLARPAEQRSRRALIAPHLPVWLALLAVTALHAWTSSRTGQITGTPYENRLLLAPALLARYAHLTLWPADLCIPYPWTPQRPPSLTPFALYGAGLLAALAVSAVCLRRLRRPAAGLMLAAVIWWPAALLPVLQLLLPIPRAFAERYAALSTLSVALAVAALVGPAARRAPRPTYAVVVLFLLVQVALTLDRLPDWRDSRALWVGGVLNAPNNPAVHYKLGVSFEREARQEKAHVRHRLLRQARKHYTQATELAPTYPAPWNNLGKLAELQEDWKAARACYDNAIACDEPLSEALFNRARMELRRPGPAQLMRARAWLESAIAIDPNPSEYWQLKRRVEARLGIRPPRGG